MKRIIIIVNLPFSNTRKNKKKNRSKMKVAALNQKERIQLTNILRTESVLSMKL
jgi:hypothetical protein